MADMSTLGWVKGAGVLLQVFGMLGSSRAARQAGERARAAAEFAAAQLDQQSVQAVAVAQRQAAEDARQSRLATSRALAVAAASGAGVSDPTIVRLLARGEAEGAYRAQVSLYEGEARARQLRMEAAAARYSGESAAAEGRSRATGLALGGLGTGLRGAASLYAKYGGKGPDAPAGSGDSATVRDTSDYGYGPWGGP